MTKRFEPCPLPSKNPTKSFWHSEPDEFLLGHRTTPQLPRHSDIVIVGTGLTGTSAARWLKELDTPLKSKNVLMLEAREACWGATGRNGGHLQPLLYQNAPDIGRFEIKNCNEVTGFIKANSVPCELRTLPSCHCIWSESVFAEDLASVRHLKQTAPDLGALVEAITSADELPAHRVRPECPGAIVTQGAGSLWPYKLCAWMLRRLIREQGVNLQTNTPVEKVEMLSPEGVGFEEPRVRLHTSRGSVTTSRVLLATNAWTSHLLPQFANLIVPVREHMSALVPPNPAVERLPHSYGFRGLEGEVNIRDLDYLIQRPLEGVPNHKGHLMFGGGRIAAGKLPSVGEADDSVVDPAVVMYLRRVLQKGLILGGGEGDTVQEELELEAAWSGIWAASRDNRPWVGPVPGMNGLWLCGAYTGHGMPNATLCAKAVVRMMAETGDLAALQECMVKEGDLPKVMLLTEERMRKAGELPTVLEQDMNGVSAMFRT